MRIQHNILAMNAYRNYNNNTSALAKNLEKLSSGYKINRAGDDAAGLAISEKMRAQITGLNAAQKNVKDGISLVKTAEGAMQEIQDMLNRMDYLATQSANGTYDNEVDRANLQKEVDKLKEEIDRIADSANFNGIKLLNGEMEEKKVESAAATPAGADAISTKAEDITTTDGQHPSTATKATIEFTTAAGTGKLDAADTGFSGDITSGTTTAALLGAMTVGGLTLKDNFTLKDEDGNEVAWTGTTPLTAGKKYTLEANTAGELKGAVDTALSGKDAVSYTPGVNEGSGSPANRAEYTLTFDFTNLAGGQKFEIGDKKFEIITGDAANVTKGYTAIDLSTLNLKEAGATNTEGQWGAAKNIQDALNTAFGTNFNVDAVPTAAPTGDSYTIKMVAKNAETVDASNNLGDVRVSETDKTDPYTGKSGITGTYKPGQVAGPGQAGTYATVTYNNFDISKLAVGDKLSIYGKEIEVVADDATEDLNNGKLHLATATDAGKLTAAFERMFRDASQGNNQQQNFGKLSIDTAAKTLTVTDSQDVGRTGTELKTDVALSFTPKTAADAGSAAQYNAKKGGLTLQIGDTSDTFNQMSVSIGDMHVKSMGTNYTVDADGNRTNNTDEAGNVTVIAGKSIKDIDISTQKGAAEAINIIKDAINYVSSVRGDLGATQNRLEHTANNLSVMAENIQDAESTIRDTDVAEEMMAYTKNNILIQSAQAMLAQANAVPQGVLQLLG